MVFSSLIFLYAFFPLCLLAYSLCRTNKSKNIALLLFSLLFYAWGEPKYVLLLMFMSLCSWWSAIGIDYSKSEAGRKFFLAFACVMDIALIGFFKYSGLVCSIFGDVPEFISNIALPIGISFYTFQLMTYVIDVYRREAEAQYSYLNVLLYAALFHQCIAGPIVRYKSIDRELFGMERRNHEWGPGISRFSAGLAKKVLLANPCGALADKLILATSDAANPELLSQNIQALSSSPALSVWLGVFAYTLQIYLDFSAYSDMAIGMGKMLGLHYPENFNYPYISRSVKEFWRRWHISLSTFFRDYVYIPLGGNRRGPVRWILNTFIVWALTGLWHGASWNYVLWGLWFFVFLMLERAFLGKILEKIPVLSNIYLLLVVMLGWVLFRFTDMSIGAAVVKSMFGLNGNGFSDFVSLTVLKNNMFLLIVCIFVCTPIAKNIGSRLHALADENSAFGALWMLIFYWVLPIALLLLSTAGLVGESYNPFIYFQF